MSDPGADKMEKILICERENCMVPSPDYMIRMLKKGCPDCKVVVLGYQDDRIEEFYRKFLWGLTCGILYFALLLLVSLGVYRSLQGNGANVVTTLLLCAGGGMLGGNGIIAN